MKEKIWDIVENKNSGTILSGFKFQADTYTLYHLGQLPYLSKTQFSRL